MHQPPKQHPQAHNVRIRDTLLSIAKSGYFIHHAIASLYTVMLLTLQPRIRNKLSLSLIVCVFYGGMVFWLFALNLICVMIKKDVWAVWCNRFIAKMIIMLFPLFFFVSLVSEQFLNLRSVTAFMVYLLILSVTMIIYEVYSCSWGHHQQPQFLYRPNTLDHHYNSVWEKRKEFNQLKAMKKKSGLQGQIPPPPNSALI